MAANDPKGLDQKEINIVAKQSVWGLVGNLFNYFFAFFANIVYARTLGADEYGIYVAITSLFLLLSPFVVFAFDRSLILYLTKNIRIKAFNHVKGILGSVMLLSGGLFFVTVLGVLLFQQPLSDKYLKSVDLGIYILLGIAFLMLTTMRTILETVVNALKNIKVLSLGKIIHKCFQLIAFLVLFLFIGITSAEGLFYAQIAGLTIVLLYYLRANRQFFKTTLAAKSDLSEVKPLLQYSLTLLAVAYTSTIIQEVDKVMLAFYLEPAEIAKYAVALKIAATTSFFGASVALIFRPMVAEKFGNKEMVELNVLYQTITRWVLVLTLPYALALVFFPGNILLIFGEEFIAGGEVLQVMLGGMVVQLIFGLSGIILIMTGKKRYILMVTFAGLAVNISLNLLFIPVYGAVGAAWATLISILVSHSLQAWLLKKEYSLKPYEWIDFFKLCVLIVVIIAINYYFESLPLPALSNYKIIPALVLNYGVALTCYFYFLMKENEKHYLNKFLAKIRITVN